MTTTTSGRFGSKVFARTAAGFAIPGSSLSISLRASPTSASTLSRSTSRTFLYACAASPQFDLFSSVAARAISSFGFTFAGFSAPESLSWRSRLRPMSNSPSGVFASSPTFAAEQLRRASTCGRRTFGGSVSLRFRSARA